jgi:hypothetical protein
MSSVGFISLLDLEFQGWICEVYCIGDADFDGALILFIFMHTQGEGGVGAGEKKKEDWIGESVEACVAI